ncbi:unnamed protein product [Pedinophyceae sp. YPF-701]|nr:unnamed protein product [Pedinophyceae sp. YPF-701]
MDKNPHNLAGSHKDKDGEKLRKELAKEERAAKKEEKKQHELEMKRLAKEERMMRDSDSKRARADARDAQKKAAHVPSEACEHGVHSCRICHPVQSKKDHVSHHKDKPHALVTAE